MSNSSAQKRGNNILQKYLEGKNNAKSAEKSYSRSYENDNEHYFEAVADGSRLAQAYSATKRQQQGKTSFADDSDEAKETSPLDLIRSAMLKLNGVDADNVAQITNLLQGVEDHLEKASSSRNRVQNRLAFSAEKVKHNRSSIFDDDSHLDEPLTPTALNKSHNNKERATFMENQLDLNESEMEYYEKIINDLADKMDKLLEEKEELVQTNAALGDRLKRIQQNAQEELNRVRAECQEKVNDIKEQLDAAYEQMTKEADRSDTLLAEIKQLNKERLSVQDLQRQLANEQANSDSLKRELREAKDRLLKSPSKFSLRDAEDQEKMDLKLQIEELQMSLDDNREEMDTLTSTIENLRNQLDTGDDSASDLKVQNDDLRKQVARLNLQLMDREKLVDELNTKSAALNTAVTELNNQIKKYENGSNKDKDRLLFGSPGSSSGGGNNSPLRSPHRNVTRRNPDNNTFNVSRSDFSFRIDDIRTDTVTGEKQILMTPIKKGGSGGALNSSVLNQSQHPRSHMKTYMENQLDLNESEMEYYENIINGLVEKFEGLRREKDDLQNDYNKLLDQQGSYDQTVHELQTEIEKKSRLIENLRKNPSIGGGGSPVKPIREPGALTDSFLGITNTFDSDGEDYRSPKGANAASGGFRDDSVNISAANESFFQKDNVEELRQKVKFQVSQLQSLQESVAVQKSAVAELKLQKAKLKTKVDELTIQLEQLTHKDSVAWKRIEELESELHTLQEENKEYRKQLQKTERHASELEQVMGELTHKNTEYRLLLESTAASNNASAVDLLQTPGRSGLITDGATPLKSRLTRTEAQVDELTVQLRLATKAKEDIQLELEKLQIRFTTKSRQADDFSKEIQSLKEDLDLRLQELDKLKLQEMKADAAFKIKQIDFESEIALLKDRLRSSEASVLELNELISTTHSEVHKERESNTALRALVDKISESGQATDSLIEGLKDEHDKVSKQLNDAHDELHHKNEVLSKYQVHVEQLESQLRAAKEANAAKEREIEHRHQALEKEALSIKNNMSSFREDSEAHVTMLKLRLDAIASEKAAVESQLKEQKHTTARIEKELAEKTAEYKQAGQAVAAIADVVASYQSKLSKLEDSLQKTVSSKLTSFDARLRSLAAVLSTSVSRTLSHTQEMSEQLLRESQTQLRKALQRHEEDAAEKDDLWHKLQEARREVELVNTLLNDTKHQLTDQINSSKLQAESEVVISAEEYGRIAHRLSEAEQRAVQMSTEGAKAFARSAKSIAYLEGECSRLKTLVDHFRVVNVKLTGDLKAANIDGMQSKSLDHRIKLLTQDEQVLKQRIAELEALLVKKNQEIVDAEVNYRRLEEKQAIKFETELTKLNDAIQFHQDKWNQLKRDFDNLNLTDRENESLLRLEIETVNEKLKQAEKESLLQINRYEDSEYELRQLRTLIQEKDHHYEQAELRISMLEQDVTIARENHQSQVRDLTGELDEKQKRIRHLEGNVSKLKVEMLEMESSFNQRYEEVSVKLLKRAQADEENRQLKLINDAHTQDVNSLTISNEELRHSVSELTRELDSLREQHNVVKNETLRRTTARLEEAERDLSRTIEDLSSASKELTLVREQLASTKAALESSDAELQKLQSEYIVVQSSEQVLKITTAAQAEEAERMRIQLEELLNKLSINSRDMATMRGQINDQSEIITDLENQIVDYETKLKNSKARIVSIDNSESLLASELKVFSEGLFVGQSLHSTSTVGGTLSAPGSFNIGKDLFASPPLVVGRSLSGLPTGDVDSVVQHHQYHDSLAVIKTSFETFRTKTEALVNTYNSLHDNHEQLKKDREELKKKLDKTSEKLQLVSMDRDEAYSKLAHSEAELTETRRLKSIVEQDREVLINNHEAVVSRAGAILSDLDSTLLEALAKANDVVAGIVSIDTDALPNLSISQSVIRHGDASGKSKKGESTLISVLGVSSNEVDRATAYLISVITSLVGEFNAKKMQLEKLESVLDAKEKSWVKERLSGGERVASLDKEIESLKAKLSHSVVELEANRLEIDRLKHQISDITRNNSELEGEFKTTSDVNSELRTALNEAEAVCMDLRSRIRVLQSELDKKIDECTSINDQLESTRKRATENELLHEKTSALLGRVKAEKEALDNVRRSLESELERSRSEVIALREQTRSLDESNRAAFEAEKLLAGLSTTLDQLMPAMEAAKTATASGSRDNSPSRKQKAAAATGHKDSFTFTSPNAKAASTALVVTADSNASLPVRVDAALKRLSLLRSLSRDDARNRLLLERQMEGLSQETLAAQAAADDFQRQLKKALALGIEKDNELKDRAREAAESLIEVQRLKDEVSRLKREGEALQDSLDHERRSRQRLLTDIQTKDTDVTRLGVEMDSRSNTIIKLKEQLNTLEDQLQDAQVEGKHRAEQLRSAKQANDRMIETIEQLERSAEDYRRERENFERKLLEAENTNVALSRARQRVSELEQQLARANDETRSQAHDLVLAEEKQQLQLKDIDTYKRRITALETRIDTILVEKNTFVDEMSETRRRIALAKEQAEAERQQRILSEAAVEALRKAGEEKRFLVDEFTAKNEEIESRQAQAEEEKRSLRNKIHQLNMVVSEKESQYVAEAHDKLKLEKDIKQLKSALAKRTQELTTSANYSSMLRTEGRNARKQVLEAVGQIREIVNVIRIDAQSVGVEISSPEPKAAAGRTTRSQSLGEFDEETLTLGLGEALGINELSNSLDALRSAIVFVRSAPKSRMDLENLVRRLENENNQLKKEYAVLEGKKNELVNQYKSELHTMQLQITEVRRTDSKNPHLAHQISVLETNLKQERERREKALHEVESLNARIERMTQEMVATRHANSQQSSYYVEMESLRNELDKQKAEYASLSHELDAVNHHRTVLRDTVDQLDKQLKQKTDMISEMQFKLDSYNGDEYHGLGGLDEEALRKQVLRYKARSAAMDDLANIYRVSVLALYADGASYSAAQFGWQPVGIPQEFANKGVHVIGVGWIEREVNSIKHSFEDEIRLLDSEVGELRSKLRQSNSYIVELRKRYEDSMMSIYRSGKGSTNDGAMQQFEQMRLALDNSQNEIASLHNDLAQEKARSRQRHLQLVDDLTRTLQARDAALSALHRLEKYCAENQMDIKGMAVYATMKSELSPQAAAKYRSFDIEQDQRTLNSLVRNLAESDHEVTENERRESRRTRDTSQHHYRSSSHGSGNGMRVTSNSTSFQHTSAVSANTSRRESPPKLSSARRSPEQQAPQITRTTTVLSNGRVVEEHLTESYLTDRAVTSTAAGAAATGSSARGSLSRTAPAGVAANSAVDTSNSSFNLQTVGHHAGNSSLRVNRATPTGQIGTTRGGVAMK